MAQRNARTSENAIRTKFDFPAHDEYYVLGWIEATRKGGPRESQERLGERGRSRSGGRPTLPRAILASGDESSVNIYGTHGSAKIPYVPRTSENTPSMRLAE